MMNGVEEWQSYTTICRLCMQRDGFMLGIFNRIQGKDRCIYQKIMDCTALEVSSSDGLPNSICHRCLYKIEFCLEFRQQCFVSDATLRQINGLSKEIQATLQPDCESNVVMVVDPNTMDYVSDYESDSAIPPLLDVPLEHPPSDVETVDTIDTFDYKNVHMCKYCDRAFTDKQQCNRHENEEHDAAAPYRCAVCTDRCFPDRNTYSTHLKTEHLSDKPYACPECARNFTRRSDLRKHTIVHTGVKPFTCPICGKSFSRNTNLSKHVRIHKGRKPFVCQHCPRTFTTQPALKQHVAQHDASLVAEGKPFACTMCNMRFARKDKLLRHQKRHLPFAAGTSDATAELAAMRENLLSEYGVVAPEFGQSQDSNDNHLVDNHENMIVNIDPFQTETNGAATSADDEASKYDGLPTSQLSTGTTSPPIDHCQPNNDSLNMGITADERPFSCNLCSKAFFRKRELERHQATHSGVKKFQCQDCEKRFSRKDKLLRHSRIHDAIKEECPVCMASFNRRDGLLQHMKTHVKIEKDTG